MQEHDEYSFSLLEDLEYVHEDCKAPDIFSIKNLNVSDVLQSVRENLENIQNYENIGESVSSDNFQDHYHPSLYTTQCWAQAFSHDERAWAVDPSRAPCELGTYFQDEITKTYDNNDLEYIDCETPDNSSIENVMESDVLQNHLESLGSIQNDESIPESANSDNFHDEISITNEKNYKREANIYICEHFGETLEEKSKLTTHITTHNISEIARKDELFCNTRLAAKNLDHDTSNLNINYESSKKCDSNTAKNCDTIHTQNISNLKTFKCSKCDLIFCTNRSLNAHNRIHPQEKPYKCSVCFSTFMYKNSLNRHTKIHTVGKPYKCTICNSKFTYKDYLKVHMSTHTGKKPHECSVCNKKFINSSNLRAHMGVHTQVNTYKCTVCDSKLSSNAILKRHMKIHTKEKSYNCTVCNSKFIYSNNFKVHMRRHKGEKPHECTECDKKFVTTNELVSHKRVHTKEKPYKCTVCDSKFSQNRTLKAHMRSHQVTPE